LSGFDMPFRYLMDCIGGYWLSCSGTWPTPQLRTKPPLQFVTFVCTFYSKISALHKRECVVHRVDGVVAVMTPRRRRRGCYAIEMLPNKPRWLSVQLSFNDAPVVDHSANGAVALNLKRITNRFDNGMVLVSLKIRVETLSNGVTVVTMGALSTVGTVAVSVVSPSFGGKEQDHKICHT
jgi:hypothetical protein